MRTQAAPFTSDVLHELLRWLTDDKPDELSPDGQPVYHLKALKDLIVEMPLFDEWGSFLRGRNIPRGPCFLGFNPARTVIAQLPPRSCWATHWCLPPSPGSTSGWGWW